MCGCTCVGRPACSANAFRRERTWLAVRRVPRRLTKSAGSVARASWRRASLQAISASSTGPPTGTLRRLEPLPSTCAVASTASTQPAAAGPACTSKPTNSPTRKPQPYSSSTMQRSRKTRMGSPWSGSCEASATASSTPRALGKGLGALGARMPSTGLALTSPWRPHHLYRPRQADSAMAMLRGPRPRSRKAALKRRTWWGCTSRSATG